MAMMSAGGVSGRVVSGIDPHRLCAKVVSGGGATIMVGGRCMSQE